MSVQKTSFIDFINNQLNEEQKRAVLHTTGALMVCAGAGSGKTRVITARIANLILHEHALPSSIVALTFTNKAGKEMKDRIKQFIDVHHAHELPFIGTFHSYCLNLLKSNPQIYDPFFTLIDQDDQEKLIKELIKRFGIEKKLTPRKALGAISHIKNHGIAIETVGDPLIRNLFTSYDLEKKRCKALDFDDLLLEVLHLFKTNTTFKEQFQQKIQHILIDEYQDTNYVQHELLKHMTTKKGELAVASVCVVGDEDQSIYSWRGATISNILEFHNDFPEVTHITIEQNYRSVTPILETANAIIKHNHARREKQLRSNKKAHDRVRVIQCASEYHESDVIIAGIKEASMFHDPSKIAVLYRSHHQSRSIEEGLIKNAIAYKIIGGIQFYERAEIKDLLAYLRLIVNPHDRISFMRAINIPARGFGDKFIELFMQLWQDNLNYTFKDIASLILSEHHITKNKETALKDFLTLFNGLDENNATSILEKVVNKIGYIGHLRNAYDHEESESKIENVQEFIQALYYFEQQGITSLAHILDEIALMQELSSKKTNDNCIKLMTIHAAKGLEFNCVFLSGLEDGIFPSNQSLHEAKLIEEERRLMYVAVTRAQERLLITTSRFRTTYGQMTAQTPSRFISEIPTDHARLDDGSAWNKSHLVNYMGQWFAGQTTRPIHNHYSSEKIIKPQEFSISGTSVRKEFVHTWSKHEAVTHPLFGVGLIELVEKKGENKTTLTIRFNAGRKKIDSSFVQKN